MDNWIGTTMITAERKRQVEKEKWLPSYDDEHNPADLASAGISYALDAVSRLTDKPEHKKEDLEYSAKLYWPWEEKYWKPTKDIVRQLVKAGALIAAEIDRIERGKGFPPKGR